MKSFFYRNANKSGVYKITNNKNNRIYYGSCKRFKQRAYEHRTRLIGNRHSNPFLQNDFNKCGKEAFEFHVVKVVDGEERKIVEQQFINEVYDHQKQCYNIKPKTVITERNWFSRTPEETKKLLSQKSKAMWADPKFKAKMKKIHSDPEFRKKQSKNQKKVSQDPTNGNSAEAHKKRHATKEHREKHSQALKKAWSNDGGRRKKASKIAKKVYEANKDKIAKARTKAKAKYHGKVISPDGKVYEVYNLDGFCREHEIRSSGNFWNLMNGRQKTCEGWKKI